MIPDNVKLTPGMRLEPPNRLSHVTVTVHRICEDKITLRVAYATWVSRFTYPASVIRVFYSLMPSSELARNADDTC